jgi:hypothetical protein
MIVLPQTEPRPFVTARSIRISPRTATSNPSDCKSTFHNQTFDAEHLFAPIATNRKKRRFGDLRSKDEPHAPGSSEKRRIGAPRR